MRNTEYALLATLALLGACDQQPLPAAHASASPRLSLCERQLLFDQDLSGILAADIVSHKPIAGDVQSCQFGTAGFPGITVSARPGVGRATVQAWADGKMPLPVSVIGGLGDGAVWQDGLHELIAQQNDLLCDVQVQGAAGDLEASPQMLPKALGTLCAKIFARF